eukprot:9782639-Alexandrium_andersonii.AAC.1
MAIAGRRLREPRRCRQGSRGVRGSVRLIASCVLAKARSLVASDVHPQASSRSLLSRWTLRCARL